MKNTAFLILPASLLCLLLSGCGDQKTTSTPDGVSLEIKAIAVNQYIDHPNLEEVYSGFQETMAKATQSKGWKIEYRRQIANGDISTAAQIAAQQVASRPALILALATPSAQASVNAAKGTTVPIIFGAITDPVSAGLVASLDTPAGNATGSSDRWPYEKQFELIHQLLPKAKTVGIPFNPGESNSVASMKLVREALLKVGLRSNEVAVANTGELIPAVRKLIGSSDVLFAPADNTVLSGLDAVVKMARQYKKPLFVGDEGSVKKGGVATYGIDYRELGRATGTIAMRVLQGEKSASIPVSIGAGARLVVNPTEAERQGLKLPDWLIKQAVVVGE